MGKSFKANEKLHDGSHYIIGVGHRFYAGETAETREVVVPPPSGKLGSVDRYWFNRWPQSAREARDSRKKTTATYLKPRKRPELVIRKELTGKLFPKLVDKTKEAKKYRRKDLAESACERLKNHYSELDVKISVHLIEGDPK
jgi:hypothetical protein